MEFSGLEPVAFPFFKTGVVGPDLKMRAHDSRHSRAIIIMRCRVPGEKGGERRVSQLPTHLSSLQLPGLQPPELQLPELQLS